MARGGGTWAERKWPLPDAGPVTGNWFPMEANGDGLDPIWCSSGLRSTSSRVVSTPGVAR